MSEAPDLLILHGVARAGAPLAAIQSARPGDPVRLIPAGPFVALATAVRRADLPVAPERVFEDADRAAAFALAHNRILAEAAERVDVAPIALGAAVRDDGEAAALILARAEAFALTLARIEGCVEYVARVLAPEGAPAGSRPEPVEASASGRSYLARRRDDVAARRDRIGRLEAFCDEAERRLAAHAREARRAGQGAGALGPRRLLDLAVLVERDRAPALIAEGAGVFEDARALGLTFEVSGPWPAYSFAALADGAAA